MQICAAALAALVLVGAGATRSIEAREKPSNPVSRVVDLLQGLRDKLEKDMDKEKDLFERYECWYTTIRDTKSATNVAANDRISELEKYIADVEGGKVEFTSERSDLTVQVAQYKRDLEAAKTMREHEAEDFAAAKEELEQGIAALAEAVEVLEEGQGGGKAASPSLLAKAFAISKDELSTQDARFFQRLLVGEVPKADWKKLNRKATFKDKYNVRSGKILAILRELHESFVAGLADAERKEADAQAAYETLKASKEALLEDSEQALSVLAEEMGARGMALDEAKAEVDSLKEQVANDLKFIEQAEAAYKVKKAEYDDRTKLRNTEMTGISEAISVLHSDDARDHFKKVYASQGYSFLQLAGASQSTARLRGGLALHAVSESEGLLRLRHAASMIKSISSDSKIAVLAARLALANGAKATSGAWMDAVVRQIDNLLATLGEEENSDLKQKESCEKQLARTSREAAVTSRAIDELTDAIAHLKVKVAELDEKIKEEVAAEEELRDTIKTMQRQRDDEKRAFEGSQADDTEAIRLIMVASDIITEMQNSLKSASLLQSHTKRGPPVIEAGVAPPPPPATWDNPTYTGAQGEHDGVVNILLMVKEDVEKDMAAGATAEEEAARAFEAETADLEASAEAANAAASGFREEQGNLEETMAEKGTAKTDEKTALAATMEEHQALVPGCNFFLVNYGVRNTNRQTEMDGLRKAKAILQGASFSDA